MEDLCRLKRFLNVWSVSPTYCNILTETMFASNKSIQLEVEQFMIEIWDGTIIA